MINPSIYDTAKNLLEGVSQVSHAVDSKFEKISPTGLILATASAAVAFSIFSKYFQKGWEQSNREQLGELALRISYIKEKYIEDIEKELQNFQESFKRKWQQFGPLYTEIPEEGLSVQELLLLIEKYSCIVSSGLKDKHISGTIYSKNLDCDNQSRVPKLYDEKEDLSDDVAYFTSLSKKLNTLFTYAFDQAYLWNSLHSDEFSIGACIEYQVVRMVGNMFGSSKDEVMGFVTSGGTESLMVALRSYRDWGMKERGHLPGEGVIIASRSVHAAIMKASQAYLLKVAFVKTDEKGRVNISDLEDIVKKYGEKVVAIVGSSPSYPTGVIDPIQEMSEIAQKYGCGMHVDCCLGAFIINNLDKHNTNYLNLAGVTSLSADTHKNGLAPKGSSVLVTKKLGLRNLAYYSIYAIPDWKGGIYGTPKDAGSQSCVPALHAYLALLVTGKNGYKRIAKKIHDTTSDLSALISDFENKLKLVADPEVNVVAFKIDDQLGLQKGATYAFAHEMSKQGIILNTISDDTAHFCVTLRFASQEEKGLNDFKKAAEESLKAVQKLNDDLIKEGKKFSGNAGMYCALEAAISPNINSLPILKYWQNLLLGRHAAKDVVRAYFLAQLDPNIDRR